MHSLPVFAKAIEYVMQAQVSQGHPELVLAYLLSDFLILHILSNVVLYRLNITYLFFVQILDHCKYRAH